MEQILLLDADPEHAPRVEQALRSVCRQIVLCADSQLASSLLRTCHFDLAVVVPAPSDAKWCDWVESIRAPVRDTHNPPMVVCLLRRPYRGPDEKVYAARKGFKVVYER